MGLLTATYDEVKEYLRESALKQVDNVIRLGYYYRDKFKKPPTPPPPNYYNGKNYVGQSPMVANDATFEYCNLTQRAQDTKMFIGITGLTFKECNLVNCSLPNDAILINCNNTQKKIDPPIVSVQP